MSSGRYIGVGHYETTPKIRELVNEVLDSGRISYGPMSQRLESLFSAMHMRQYGVLSASGTDSLRAALHALHILDGWNEGDEVIVPATTFVASINVITQLNLHPVLVDVEPDFYCIDTDKALSAITGKTVAIMPVNLLGQPANLGDVAEIAKIEGLRVVEDSCETMFVKHRGVPVGAWGDIGAFSFYMAHLITAGVGGIAITNNGEVADIMRSLVNHGRSPVYISIDDDDDLSGDALIAMIRQRYAFMYPGYSSRITELQAALALPQLENYGNMIVHRQRIASALTDGLRKHERAGRLLLPAERERGQHAYMMYGIQAFGEHKWPLMKHLEENGIETREMLPIVNQKMYRSLAIETINRGGTLSVSSQLIDTGFYIGCHQGMDEDDVDYICEIVDSYYEGT